MEKPCVICQAEPEEAEKVWYAYATRLRVRDAYKTAKRVFTEADLSLEDVGEHLREHHFVQPGPPGKPNRNLALQEAMNQLHKPIHLLLQAIYRAQALSLRQIEEMFYIDQAEDPEPLRERMRTELRKLSYRSFLYQLWPENIGTLSFDDPGPYYLLNRQACPVVERLEGLPAESIPFGAYVTSLSQVKEFYLERDSHFVEVIISLRRHLYQRPFMFEGREMQVHLGIEHWYAPVQTHCSVPSLDGKEEEPFAPSGLVGFRMESRDGTFSTLLPVWFEYDNGTDDPGEVAAEILRYGAYYKSEGYRKQFPRMHESGVTGPLIVICEDAYRREEIGDALKRELEGQEVPIYLTERPSLLGDPYASKLLLPVGNRAETYHILERAVHHNRKLIDRRVFSGTERLNDPPVHQLLASGRPAPPVKEEKPATDPFGRPVKPKPKPKPDLSAWTTQDG